MNHKLSVLDYIALTLMHVAFAIVTFISRVVSHIHRPRSRYNLPPWME